VDQIGQLAQLSLPLDRALTGSPARTTADVFIEDLFQRHHAEIYAYLVRMLRDPELAADLTQDAFIKAYRAHESLEDPAHARAWLYQIAHRVALDEIRRRKIVRFLPWTGESHGTAPSADGGYAHYGAAKAAIAHYTRYLAQDLGPFGITANCIAPGVIATGRIMATVIPGSSQSNRDRSELVALRRLGTVEDCARVIEFLATDLSDYVTGAVIPIDGGLVRG